MRRLLGFLLVSVALLGRPASATEPWDLPTDIPSIVSATKTEVAPSVFQWDYQVDYGHKPTLSHWTLEMCENAFNSLYDVKLDGGLFSDYEFKPPTNPDPTTGAVGFKFDDLEGEGTHLFSFKTNVDWIVNEDATATFKAGQDGIAFQTTIAPGCEVNEPPIGNPPPPVPEPGTMAMLGLGVPTLLKKFGKRANKK